MTGARRGHLRGDGGTLRQVQVLSRGERFQLLADLPQVVVRRTLELPDLLVGVVEWDADAEGDGLRTSHIHFSWRDSVQFSDGTVVDSTGRFVKDRPPGLVVIAIIAILIGMLLPAYSVPG